jgi:uncharacterized protein
VNVAGLDWTAISRDLDELGSSLTGAVLAAKECNAIAALYDDDRRFRSTIDMARFRFGQGQYRYFDRPLPKLVAELRAAFWPHLLPIARTWAERLGQPAPWPDRFEDWIEQCHDAGQTRPTPLLLRYGPGDWNALHRDLYGDVYFPFQALTVLSERGVDYEGGEFVLVEQRPRAQSRAHVIAPPRGAFVLFPTRERPNAGRNGYHRVGLRHGVSTISRGQRTALGIIFHDSR